MHEPSYVESKWRQYGPFVKLSGTVGVDDNAHRVLGVVCQERSNAGEEEVVLF